MSERKTFDQVTDREICSAFDQIAHDLLEASMNAGEKEHRIYLGDAADAVFNHLTCSGPVQSPGLEGIDEAFDKVKKALRGQYIPKRGGKYIYL